MHPPPLSFFQLISAQMRHEPKMVIHVTDQYEVPSRSNWSLLQTRGGAAKAIRTWILSDSQFRSCYGPMTTPDHGLHLLLLACFLYPRSPPYPFQDLAAPLVAVYVPPCGCREIIAFSSPSPFSSSPFHDRQQHAATRYSLRDRCIMWCALSGRCLSNWTIFG